jgi:cell division protein ZapA
MIDKAKTKMTINIMGVDYQVITDDDPNRVKMIADFVDTHIKETKKTSPYMTNTSATVLSALNLSEELFRIKDDVEELKEKEQEYHMLMSYKDKLTDAMEELEDNETKNKIMKSRLERLESENNELNELMEEYKDKFNTLRTEYELSKRTVSELQNKLLENQLELVKARKNLLDFTND